MVGKPTYCVKPTDVFVTNNPFECNMLQIFTSREMRYEWTCLLKQLQGAHERRAYRIEKYANIIYHANCKSTKWIHERLANGDQTHVYTEYTEYIRGVAELENNLFELVSDQRTSATLQLPKIFWSQVWNSWQKIHPQAATNQSIFNEWK